MVMSQIVWPVISSVLSTFVTGGVFGMWKAIQSTHKRFDKMEEHLRKQDERIARIEGRLSAP